MVKRFKNVLYISILLLCAIESASQSKEAEAQFHFNKAEDHYLENDYEQSLKHLNEASDRVGNNPKILYLKINAKFRCLHYSEDTTEIRNLRLLIDSFFTTIDESAYPKDKLFKIVEIKELIAKGTLAEVIKGNTIGEHRIIGNDMKVEDYRNKKFKKQDLQDYDIAIDLAAKKKYKEAISSLEKLIEKEPDLIDAYLSLAGLYGQIGHPKLSTIYYEKALKKSPNTFNDLDMYLPYSLNLAKLGRFSDALDVIEKQLAKKEIQPKTKKAAEYRRKQYLNRMPWFIKD